MTDQQIATSTQDEEAKSKPIANEPAKPPNNKQTKIRPRYLPSPPGFFPIPMDIVITMTMQFLLTFTCILVIFASAVIDRDDIGWYIFAQVIFAFIGFGYFTRKIKENFLVYDTFYKRLDSCTDRRIQKLKNSDSNLSCLWMLLLIIIYWILIILIFPLVMLWSMYYSYKWYQDRRKKVHTEESQRDLEANNNYKKTNRINKRVYNIWHLGVLCKNASMISVFIQELPFLIICGIIGNSLGLAIFPIVICIKFIFWIKHCYDLRAMTIFYKSEDFLLHFGMLEIYVDFETKEIIPTYLNDYQYELATLQKGDWCIVYVGEEEYIPDITELTDDNTKLVVIYETRDFKTIGKPNLICIDFDAIPIKLIEDWSSGKTKKINVPEDCFYQYDRWDDKLYLTLIPDELWDKHHKEIEEQMNKIEEEEAGSNNTTMDNAAVTEVADQAGDDNEENVYISIDNKATEVIDTAHKEQNKNNVDSVQSVQEQVSVVVSNGDSPSDVTEVPQSENYGTEVAEDENNVNIDADEHENNSNYEENTYTSVDNKDKEVDDNQIEAEPKVDPEQDDDYNEDAETEPLTDSPVVVGKEDINDDNQQSADYQSIPLDE